MIQGSSSECFNLCFSFFTSPDVLSRFSRRMQSNLTWMAAVADSERGVRFFIPTGSFQDLQAP